MADDGAALILLTIDELSRRAPAVIAAAAAELAGVSLAMRFGDGSAATLRARHSRLLASAGAPENPDVEFYFDARAMNLLFDGQRRPIDEIAAGLLDVRGSRAAVLAVWRTFAHLAQRGSGLRSVQQLWREFRNRAPELWSGAVSQGAPAVGSRNEPVGWTAIDFLGSRTPSGDSRVGGTVIEPSRQLWDGRTSTNWWQPSAVGDADLVEVMDACRAQVAAEVTRLIPDSSPTRDLYDLLRDYPSRGGKGLRPTLTIAACGALGGRPEDAVRSAAAMELFHNGFLIHDDISDGSTHRRGRPTMHRQHGVGLAVNAGDALNLLAVDAVLSNLDGIGLARTLGIIHEVLQMCRETMEGQAIELGWMHRGVLPTKDDAYFRMSTKKTGWYTCISPCRVGAICAGETAPAVLDAFVETFRLVGIAFQIQDDVLNLIGEEALYGKEPLGDLLEAKRTVMLIHLFRTAPEPERERLRQNVVRPREAKTQADAEEVLEAMVRHGSIDYAIGVADRLARRGVVRFERDLAGVEENEYKAVLRQIANYVTTRPL
jgi:geranylgeranyl diphosphate synthase type II